MTDLQIKYQQNALKENELALKEKELEETRRSNLAKEAETHRTNVAKETMQDLENQVKYGYDRYMPISEEGDFRRTSAWGAGQIPFDWFKNKVGGLKEAILGKGGII